MNFLLKSMHLSFGRKEMQPNAVRGRGAAAARDVGGRRAQTDAEEGMADCIAEVDDVTAGLDADERDALVPVTATDVLLKRRLDKAKTAEAAAVRRKN